MVRSRSNVTAPAPVGPKKRGGSDSATLAPRESLFYRKSFSLVYGPVSMSSNTYLLITTSEESRYRTVPYLAIDCWQVNVFLKVFSNIFDLKLNYCYFFSDFTSVVK